MSRCTCSYCVDGNKIREVYRHGGIDDGWEETPYKKPSRSNWNRRSTRPCKKSKTGEKCDQLATKVKGTVPVIDRTTNERIGNKPRVIRCCSRCGKEYWSFNLWW